MTATVQAPPAAAAPVGQAVPATGRVARFGRLLAAERIKLGSTRSPWWCAAVAVVLLAGPTALVAADPPPGGSIWGVIGGLGALPMAVVAVLAVLAATGEYRFGTIRTTFLTAADRASAVLAKAVVVAAAGAATGLVAGFSACGAAWLVAPQALTGGVQWRVVAGVGLVYAVVAVFGVGAGVLLRHGGGALTALLVTMTVGEGVLSVLPVVGPVVTPWLPFTNLARFLTVGVVEPDPARSFFGERLLFGPWAALGYAAAVAAAVLVLAVLVARRRDA